MEKYTFTEMKEKNKEIGNHWFDKGAMRFFNTVFESRPNKYNIFITSDRMDETFSKAYALRIFSSRGNVETIGSIRDYKTLDEAKSIRNTISKALDTMGNRETLILKNLVHVEVTDDWVKFIGEVDGERKSFDVCHKGVNSGKIVG